MRDPKLPRQDHWKTEIKVAVAAVAVGLGLVGSAGEALAERKRLVIGMGYSDIDKLDPHKTAAGQDKAVISAMFNGLVRIRPGQSRPEFIEPDLAESWSSNEDKTEWIFKLRRDVRCHGGLGQLTARDVVYSLKRAADPKQSRFSADFAALKEVTAVDLFTVKVILENPIPSFLGVLTSYHGGNIVCRRAAQTLGDEFARKPVGTGPFMFVEHRPGQEVRLIANKQYFRGAPRLDEVVYRFIPSDDERSELFLSGKVDLVYGIQNEAWVERMFTLPGAVTVPMEPAELSALYLNVNAPPLDDIRVRQAIAHGIDRSALVRAAGASANRPARSVIPSDNLGFSGDGPLLPYDPQRAQTLLREAGYPQGVAVKVVASKLPALKWIIEAARAQLQDVGIVLSIEYVEHKEFHRLIREDRSPLVLYQATRFPVADVYLTQFYHSSSTVNTPTGVTNFSHCAVADNEIQLARRAGRQELQLGLWREAQHKILAAVCSVPLYEGLLLWAYRDSLELGYDPYGSLSLSPQITEQTHFLK